MCTDVLAHTPRDYGDVNMRIVRDETEELVKNDLMKAVDNASITDENTLDDRLFADDRALALDQADLDLIATLELGTEA